MSHQASQRLLQSSGPPLLPHRQNVRHHRGDECGGRGRPALEDRTQDQSGGQGIRGRTDSATAAADCT